MSSVRIRRIDFVGTAFGSFEPVMDDLPTDAPRRGIDAEELTVILRFEDALADLHQQLSTEQYVRSCVACAWSDYGPAGQPLFGGLASHVCGEFERRGPGAGYRGSFPPEES